MNDPASRDPRARSANAKPERYRPEIDHLRALAVLAVIGSHLPLRPLRGGFVGVDIFFVISGFLITGIVLRETEAGEFSFGRFYERRVRRILPALVVMVLAVAAASWLLLLPSDYAGLGRSIVANVMFGSNVLFWSEAGYFDRDALDKPLLHTWSLAVEEQFYLVWPPLIWAVARFVDPARRGRALLGLTAGLGLVSLAIAALTVRSHPGAAFYLPMGRACELLLGGALAIGRPPPPRSRLIAWFAFAFALALMVVPISQYGPRTVFPGFSALLPCCGAALFIWAHSGPKIGLSGLAAQAATGFGLISYSLYLWHWPLIVLARQWLIPDRDLPGFVKLGVFLAATLAAWISYRFIEQPIRRRALSTSPRLVFASAALASVALAGFGLLAVVKEGFPGRLPPDAAALARYADYPYAEPYRSGICFLHPTEAPEVFRRDNCVPRREPGRRLVWLWGDSVAAHFTPGLREQARTAGLVLAESADAGCPPLLAFDFSLLPNCRPFNRMLLRMLTTEKPDLVILSANWPVQLDGMGKRFVPALIETLDHLQALGIPIVLLGPSITYRTSLPSLLARFALARRPPEDAGDYLRRDLFALDEQMRAAAAGRSGVTYLSVLDALCPNRSCPVFAEGRVPMQWDAFHLTVEGSRFAARVLLPAIAAAANR